jgi:hypothetical protein
LESQKENSHGYNKTCGRRKRSSRSCLWRTR